MSDFEEPSPSDHSEAKVVNDVREFGWHVVLIPEESGAPGWAFSIGLTKSFGHPEFIVFGLPQSVAHSLVNSLGEIVRAGHVVTDGQLVGGLLDGFDCTTRRVRPRWHGPFVGLALWYYRLRPIEFLQCIWPDRQARFPWDDDFQKSWLWAQPLLFNETTTEARTAKLLQSMDLPEAS